MIARLLDLLLGERCPLGCGARVYDRDVPEHMATEHAGGL